MPKTVLITGASSGIGRATALLFHSKGFTVYATARRQNRLQDLAKEGLRVLSLDVTDDQSMRTALQTIYRQTGCIDVLVNNAGYGSFGALEDVQLEEARKQFEVNVFGLARLTQLVLPKMRAANSGLIINVSSIGGRFGESLGAWYHATKYAVEGLTDSLGLELRPFNIHAVVIEPGATTTEWSGIASQHVLRTSGQTAYAQQAQHRVKVLARFSEGGFAISTADDVARVIYKAAVARRPRARYVVGTASKALLFMRRILSDRLFYALLNRAA